MAHNDITSAGLSPSNLRHFSYDCLFDHKHVLYYCPLGSGISLSYIDDILVTCWRHIGGILAALVRYESLESLDMGIRYSAQCKGQVYNILYIVTGSIKHQKGLTRSSA
jgi:hypothetical protein